jgi:hypothetical protein
LVVNRPLCPGSKLGPEADYSDWAFTSFSSDGPGKCRASALKYTTTASFYILYNSSLTLSFDAI